MEKKKLLYVSPFPPQRSGISEYSEILVYTLKKYFDITLLVDNYKISIPNIYNDFNVLMYKKDIVDFQKYDYIIYNIGNNPMYHSFIYKLCLEHPGMVILHDCVLYYLIVGVYEEENKLYSKLYDIGGIDAICTVKQALKKENKPLLECKDIASKLPLNKELASSGNKIMVHSQYAYNMIKDNMSDIENLRKINLIKQTKTDVKIIDRKKLFAKYHIPEDALIITSFGYIAETKLNHKVCEAVKELCEEIKKKICYIMVGEGDYVNNQIDNKIVFKTGYTSLDEFNSFLYYSDIVANLRYPSMGETSAAMIRIMEYGKPCLIISDAWFAELPKDCVVSLEPNQIDQIKLKLYDLIEKEDYRKKIGRKAKEFVDLNHSPDKVGQEIYEYICS